MRAFRCLALSVLLLSAAGCSFAKVIGANTASQAVSSIVAGIFAKIFPSDSSDKDDA